MKIIATLLFAVLFTVGQAQSFEGLVTYSFDYISETMDMKQYKSLLPSEELVYIKGNKSRTESESQFTGKTINIYLPDEGVTYSLMTFDTIKYAVKITHEELNEGLNPKIKYLGEEIEILGYPCKKATMEFEGDTETDEVYYTEELPQVASDANRFIKGFPLKSTSHEPAQGITIVKEATSIEEKAVDDSLFEIPDGYQVISIDELEERIGNF